jgi:hypothetical protein
VKNQARTILNLFFLALLVVFLFGAMSILLPKSLSASHQVVQLASSSSAGYPAPEQPIVDPSLPYPYPESTEPLPVATAAPIFATPTALPYELVAWGALPECQNAPRRLDGWRSLAQEAGQSAEATREIEFLLRRITNLWPGHPALDAAALQEVLNIADQADSSQILARQAVALQLNLAAGYLNTATELNLPGLPEAKTAGDLLALLEQGENSSVEADRLLQASQSLLAGQGIHRSVCTRLAYQVGSALKESSWTSDGLVERQIVADGLPFAVDSISPDNSKLILLTSPHGDTGGGPTLLYDLKTSRMIDLSKEAGIPIYRPVGMSVAGWSQGSQHVLLLDGDNNGLYWLDVGNLAYQFIQLPNDRIFVASKNFVNLSPSADLIAYFVSDYWNKERTIFVYDMQRQVVVNSINVPPEKGLLQALYYSPRGDSLALMFAREMSGERWSYAIELLDLESQNFRTLMSDIPGRTELVWSPKGDALVYRMTSPDGLSAWPQSNISVVSLTTGKTTLITDVKANIYYPMWSSDGRFIIFLAHENRIGMAPVDQPGGVYWPIGSRASFPEWLPIFTLP